MNCAHLHKLLDAYVDDELDSQTCADIAAHVGQCHGCAELLAQRRSLSVALRALPRHRAPDCLRQAIAREIPAKPASAPLKRPSANWTLRWWQALVLSGAIALAGVVTGVWLTGYPWTPDLREEVIARHAASLAKQATLLAVESSDRHTVKPWFAGKIDFAPLVRDLSEQGFTLLGGRLDSLGNQPAAVVVYRIRRHDISVFVQRAPTTQSEPISSSSLHGFSLISWAADGLRLTAISDVDGRDLRRLAEAIATTSR